MDAQIAERQKEISLIALIGNTPTVSILRDLYPQADVRIKLESFNSGGLIQPRLLSKTDGFTKLYRSAYWLQPVSSLLLL